MKTNFIFSIIMPIYNVDQWLEEAILSIINQKKINFEENVQLILVNDCSPDNSEEICLKFRKKYPNNILYYKNEKNLGLSGTRNKGLTLAEGKYINFFDPDDTLSPSVLYEVNKFFTQNSSQNLAHISIPLVFFEAASGLHPKYRLLGNKNRIIDLDKEQHNFILSSASSFYPRDNIKKNKFDTSLFGEEDTLFNFNIYSNINKFGYVCENGVQYNYRRRQEGGSQVDLSRVKPQAFITPIQILENVNAKDQVLFYELIAYQLRSRIKNIKPEIFQNKNDYNHIINRYRDFMSLIPKDFILHKTKYLETQEQKIDFISEIYRKNLTIDEDAYINIDDCKIFKCNDLPLDIKNISIEKNVLIIETLFNNFNIEDLSIVIMDKGKNIIKPIKEYYCDSLYIHKCCDIKSSNNILYSRFETPVFRKGEYRLYFKRKSNGFLHIVNRLRTYSESPFLGNGVFNSNLFKLYSEQNTSISLYKKAFYIKSSTVINKISNRIKSLFLIRKRHKTWKWLRLLKLNKPKYWLFNDRPINANDNAEAFFTYINKSVPHIAKNSYFVLDKNSPDISRIKKIGKVIIQNSLKHKLLYLNSKYIFTSHLATSFFKPISFKHLKYYNDLIETKIIWLQHGITMNNIEIAANKFNKHIYKIVTAANFENSIFKNKNFFFNKEDLFNVGFPRYDKLIKKKDEDKIVLIMPTWRSYLSGNILKNGLHAELEIFKESDYYKNFVDLLSNKLLINTLKENNVIIKFVLHPGFKQYAKYFKQLESNEILIIDELSLSYKDLFNEASLLITDYSSVFFDFSYKEKPSIFFQFDEDEFYSKHYKKGFFDFTSMAPGKVTYNTDDLISEIIKSIISNFSIKNEYLYRIRNMYKYNDNKNCERLLNEVLKNE